MKLFPMTVVLLMSVPAIAADDDWKILLGERSLEAWNNPAKEWVICGEVKLGTKNQRKLVALPGQGVFMNGPGSVRDLITKEHFTDVEVHVEFLIAKGSNSGVKLNGLYEIQILDSFGKTKLTGDDCGGIYPRAEEKPRYRQIDEGVPPRVNACKKAGEWQTLDLVFRSPRFDDQGKKTVHARFVKVALNSQVIHDNLTVKHPTGAAWVKKEVTRGPLLLQSDHGPVAFRNVRVRPVKDAHP